jgi:hypothetical protein
MDEETTTPAATDSGVVEETTQPVEAVTTEAVETTPASTEGQAEEASASAADDADAELAKWATAKGLELDSDNAKKAAKMAREAEKAMHQKAQKASELEKSVTAVSDEDAAAKAEASGQDPELIKRLQRVEVRETVRDFWNQDGIDRSYEPTMIDILKDKPYLAGDLESLYATAVMKSGGVAAIKSQAKRETLESLAHKQQAAVPTGSATTSGTPKGKAFGDLSIKEMEKKLGFVRQ